MIRVVLYTMDKCPHCRTAKRYLDQQKIPYRLCDVRTPRGRKELAAIGMRGVPVLKIGDKLLNGFSIKDFNQIYKP